MKKSLVIFALILGCGISLSAQDLITKKDGTDIQAKILEVTLDEVKYKRFNNLEGPTFTLPKSDILIVRYENGENEVFQEESAPLYLYTEANIYPGMHYRDYKDYYDTNMYVKQLGDPYTPFWIGFGEFFIPGLGNAVMGEWGRAAGFFLSNVGLGLVSMTQAGVISNGNSYRYYTTEWYWVLTLIRVGLNVWSICDAVHVAKAKNMYNQDLRALRAASSLDVKLEPYFAYVPTGISANQLMPAAGFSLKLSF